MIIDGQKVKGLGKYHKISIQIQEFKLQIGFCALRLDEMDMLLDVAWLMQWSTYTTKLEEQVTKFNWQGLL